MFKIDYNPVELTYEQFIKIHEECFPNESMNKEIFNEMKMNHMWVVFFDEKLIGYMYVKMTPESVHLSRIGISTSYRRKGIAKRLIEQLIRFSMEQKKSSITLYAQMDNQPAFDLYRKYGFNSIESCWQFVIPIREVLAKCKDNVDYKLEAIPNDDNNSLKNCNVLRKCCLDFKDKHGNFYGNCCLDPDFPGCSPFIIREPDKYFIDSLFALKTYLNPMKEELLLTFSNTLLRTTCHNMGFRLNYKLVKMQKILNQRF